MARGNKADTIRAVLDAGREVVAGEGAGRLTLDAVAGRTGITRSAILYHFRSRDALARALFQEVLDRFERALAAARGDDRSPGSYIRSYCMATIASEGDQDMAQILSAIASLNRDPAIGRLFEAAARRWSDEIDADGIDADRAQLIRLAADGLWLYDEIQLQLLPPARRQRLLARLLGMTRDG